MNSTQTAKLAAIVSTLAARRNITVDSQAVTHTMVGDNAVIDLHVAGTFGTFPPIAIGKSGRCDIPSVKSFKEDGVATAFDAVVYADFHATKGRGAAYPYPTKENPGTPYGGILAQEAHQEAQPAENTEVNQ